MVGERELQVNILLRCLFICLFALANWVAKSSLSDTLSNCNASEEEKSKAGEFTAKVSEKIFKECDSMKDTMAKLVDIAGEAKRFQQIEIGARDSVGFLSRKL